MRSARPRKAVEIARPGGSPEQERPRGRTEDGVDNTGQAGPRGQDPGHDGEVRGRGQHAGLDAGNIDRFGQPGELAFDGPGRHGQDPVHPARVLGGHGGQHPEAAMAQPFEDGDVEEYAGARAGVVAGDGDQVLGHVAHVRGVEAILP